MNETETPPVAPDTPAPLSIRGVRFADGSVGDLYTANGVLVAAPVPGAEVIAGAGLIALPGLVDPHTHLREPGNEMAETIATGTLAAARGGFSCVLAMPNTTPATNGVPEALGILQRASASAHAQVVPIGAVTYERAGERLADISGMAASPARVRVFSDDGACVMNADLLREALALVATFDGVIAEHAQDAQLAGAAACCGASVAHCDALGLPTWPREAEWRIVARDIRLAAETAAHIHICHVSTKESLELIREAKARGVRITAEAAPHHLLFSTDYLAAQADNTVDTRYKVNPPLRPDADVQALRAAVVDGTVDMIGTDHAPHTPRDKQQPFPQAAPGMVGLEQALGVVIEVLVNPGHIGWADVARLMSYAPAQLAGLSEQGQPLQVGAPANIVLIDPTRRITVNRDHTASLSRNNPYHGLELP
ncbi:MAG: dihydroorotase, partial [Propionibacteriaceae bacterium]|nr:dihydroorotase [Propionibacteriaceae bacterium]